MSDRQHQAFANRLIATLKNKGYLASRSPKGICVKTLAKFTGASEQICRRYIRGDALPDYEKIKQIAEYLQVNPGWLLFGDEGHSSPSNSQIDNSLLHYLIKKSHGLYQNSLNKNDDYADFVLGLLKEISSIETSRENQLKIIDLAIGSITYYEETRNLQSRTA